MMMMRMRGKSGSWDLVVGFYLCNLLCILLYSSIPWYLRFCYVIWHTIMECSYHHVIRFKLVRTTKFDVDFSHLSTKPTIGIIATHHEHKILSMTSNNHGTPTVLIQPYPFNQQTQCFLSIQGPLLASKLAPAQSLQLWWSLGKWSSPRGCLTRGRYNAKRTEFAKAASVISDERLV